MSSAELDPATYSFVTDHTELALRVYGVLYRLKEAEEYKKGVVSSGGAPTGHTLSHEALNTVGDIIGSLMRVSLVADGAEVDKAEDLVSDAFASWQESPPVAGDFSFEDRAVLHSLADPEQGGSAFVQFALPLVPDHTTPGMSFGEIAAYRAGHQNFQDTAMGT